MKQFQCLNLVKCIYLNYTLSLNLIPDGKGENALLGEVYPLWLAISADADARIGMGCK